MSQSIRTAMRMVANAGVVSAWVFAMGCSTDVSDDKQDLPIETETPADAGDLTPADEDAGRDESNDDVTDIPQEDPVDEDPIDDEPVDEEPVDDADEPIDEDPSTDDDTPVDEPTDDDLPEDDEPIDDEPVDDDPTTDDDDGDIDLPTDPTNPGDDEDPLDPEDPIDEPVDEDPVVDDDEPFVLDSDCTSHRNDYLEDAWDIPAVDGSRFEDLELCGGDRDFYDIELQPGQYMELRLDIDGSGTFPEDLDLVEFADGYAILQGAFTSQRFEQLAVHNTSDEAQTFTFAVRGYRGSQAYYELSMRVFDWAWDNTCDLDVDDTADANAVEASCEELIQFPRAFSDAAGYELEHDPIHSVLRRDVSEQVLAAIRTTQGAFDDTPVLKLYDMSQDDGRTPGTFTGELRHPQGSHLDGVEIDVGYYMLNHDYNASVCPNDAWFCTGDADALDAPRTAFFMSELFRSDRVRAITLDEVVAGAIRTAADELLAGGLIDADLRRAFDDRVQAGTDWPAHHHHMSVIWH